MKRRISKKTLQLKAKLSLPYQTLFDALTKEIEDDAYAKEEINYFLRKTLLEMQIADQKETDIATFTSHNEKKWIIERNRIYRSWHEAYIKKMKACDRITYAGFFSMILYSITLVVATAYMKDALSTWVWILVPAFFTLAVMLLKTLYAKRLSLGIAHRYGDFIMFLLISVICYYSNIYFIIFLWVYEVIYMFFLQYHVVEEDI